MSNYTRVENFTLKDSLDSGDPEKIITGADVDAEFNAIATAIASKEDVGAAIESGTTMLFIAESAPAGWSLVTTYNDVVPVVRNSGGISTGGNWTVGNTELAVNANATASASSSTSVNGNLPNHTHTISHSHAFAHTHTVNNHTHSVGNLTLNLAHNLIGNIGGYGWAGFPIGVNNVPIGGNTGNSNSTLNTGNPSNTNTSNANTNNSGSAGATALSLAASTTTNVSVNAVTVSKGGTMITGNWRPSYVNTIICVKS